MSTPHTCPRCQGEKKVPDARLGDYIPCPTCGGEGIVWDRHATEEAGVSDPRELTGL